LDTLQCSIGKYGSSVGFLRVWFGRYSPLATVVAVSGVFLWTKTAAPEVSALAHFQLLSRLLLSHALSLPRCIYFAGSSTGADTAGPLRKVSLVRLLDRRQPFCERQTNVDEVALEQEEDSQVEAVLAEAVAEVVALAEGLAAVLVDLSLALLVLSLTHY
jgi:hypothetical protein